MGHTYEYRIIAQWFTPTQKVDPKAEGSQRSIEQSLAGFYGQLHESIDMMGDNWEVLSHDVMVIGDVVMPSVLLRRPRT